MIRFSITDLFFPPKCVICSKILESHTETRICPSCLRKLPFCHSKPEKGEWLDSVSTPFYYEGELRESLIRYKFNSKPSYAETYGRLLGERFLSDGGDFDLLSWVPLSAKRRRTRGYDQAYLLAKHAGKVLGAEPVSLLKKTRNAPPQSGTASREARKANISGCYKVIEPELVRGKKILLIDDIYTTGATLSECARVLLTAGAEGVSAAVAACVRRND